MLKYYVVDAFADKVFEGNPAGVCILDEWLPEEKMRELLDTISGARVAYVKNGHFATVLECEKYCAAIRNLCV